LKCGKPQEINLATNSFMILGASIIDHAHHSIR